MEKRKDETRKDWITPTITEITEEDVLGGVPARFEVGANPISYPDG
ncbi:MAG: hypothetical protein ACE5HR_07685 [bacterium]